MLIAIYSLFVAAPPVAASETSNVLVLYSNNRLVPANVEVDRGLSEEVASTLGPRVQLFSEFLDHPDFVGDAYRSTMMTYLREKYSARPPDAIVVVADSALDFMLRERPSFFPNVPVVYVYIWKSHLRTTLRFRPMWWGFPSKRRPRAGRWYSNSFNALNAGVRRPLLFWQLSCTHWQTARESASKSSIR